jgi:NAD(P)H-nitrite reductase large subunit
LILGTAVQQLDLTGKQAILSDGRIIDFEKALIATSGRPVHLSIPGAHLPGVHYLRRLDDRRGDCLAGNTGDARPLDWGGLYRHGSSGLADATRCARYGHRNSSAHVAAVCRCDTGWSDSRLLRQEGRQRSNQAQVADIRGADRVSAVMLKSGDLLA